MAKVAVVILNYNGAQFLEQFLPSVVKYSQKAEVIVADNASTDQSIQFLRENYPRIRLIVFGKNLGYTGGYNQAISQLDHQYCILLNSDVEVTTNWIEPIITYMDNNPDTVACQPKILDFNNKDRFEYAGASGGFIDYMGYPYCRGRIFDRLESDHGQYNKTTEIAWATGACMFVRTSEFKTAGGFDIDFFAHMEEIDLCWRFRLMGKSIYCIPESKIYHIGGGTFNKPNPRKTYLNFRNNLSLLFKNETKINLCWKLPFKFCLDWAAVLKFGLDDSWTHGRAVLCAQWDFIFLIPKNIRKRKKIDHKNAYSLSNSRFLLPYQYFIKGKNTFEQVHKIL